MLKQFEYFLENFSLYYEVDKEILSYGKEKKAPVSITQNATKIFWDEKKDIEISNVIWKEWNNTSIPFLFEENSAKDIITYENNQVIINYDIVASAFYFLSGWNEITSCRKDEFGRISYTDSIICKLNISNIPVVNYYFDILHKAINTITNNDIRKNLWQQHNMGVVLTHDIDTCKSAWLEGSFSQLKKKHLLPIPGLIFNKLFRTDDWFNFKEISDIEKQYNAISSFYFLPQKGGTGKWKNADYKVESKSIQQALKYLKSLGNEIGVHGSFGTHCNAENFKEDIKKLNSKPVIGNRFHFLMFDPLKTVSILEECNISYDTSLSFAEQIGFRRGTCYPFYLYNFEKNKISTVMEIPLIVMDSSLGNKKYMALSKEDALTKVYELINEVQKFGGVFTLLWHNTYFSDFKYTGWREVYLKIMDYCKERNGLFTSGERLISKIKK